MFRDAAWITLNAAHDASHVLDLEPGSGVRVAAARQHALEAGWHKRVLVQVDHGDVVRRRLAAHAA